MIGEKTAIWREGEYSYPAAYGFVPFIVSYMHEDDKIRPAMLVAPGGAYRYASPYEGNLPALEFTGQDTMYLSLPIRSIISMN